FQCCMKTTLSNARTVLYSRKTLHGISRMETKPSKYSKQTKQMKLQIYAVVKKADVTKEGINAAMKAAANESFGYNEDEIVSSDIIGSRFGSIFDATQTMVSKIDDETFQVQVVSWYDNENSYTSQMVRTIKHFSNLL
ncbi:MAG: hypothetical protein IKQ54_01805, partial [Oscillospiraceae bacterium]|nr:hypothetical protein [Oscillospiraceae bacterium]